MFNMILQLREYTKITPISDQIFVDIVYKIQKRTLAHIFIRTLEKTLLYSDSYQMDNQTSFTERKKAGAWT
jgi:hypothetical protein